MPYAALETPTGLSASIVSVGTIPQADRQAMYDLYHRYYAATDRALFASDLANKDYALLLHDTGGSIRGFSTLAVIRHPGPAPVRALFSGDTVIEHAFWGQQALAFNWLRFAGQLKAREPDLPLYWFLIVKGHRTYRYLSTFSRDYYPHHARSTPTTVATLMARLARERFGSDYHEPSGLLRFASSRGHLRARWAQIPAEDLRRPEVQYFLRRNPHYARGDELACLTELSESNLRPLARRLFRQGMSGP